MPTTTAANTGLTTLLNIALRTRLLPVFLLTAVLCAITTQTSASTEAIHQQQQPYPASPTTFAIIAERALMPDGTLAREIGVIVDNGKIRRVAPADQIAAIASGITIYRFGHGSVLSPGLIDGLSEIGAASRTNDQTLTITPQRRAVEAFDVTDPSVRQAAAAGITAAILHPGATRVVAGSASVVKTAPTNTARGINAVVAEGPVVVNFTMAALTPSREPTSRAGAADLLRRTMQAARQDQAHPATNLLRQSPNNILAVCDTEADVDLALRLFAEFGITPMIAHTDDMTRLADDLAEEQTTVFIGPYNPRTPDRVLLGAGAASRASIDIVLASALLTSGEPDSMRLSAALATRYGLDPARARRAITTTPATAVGAQDRIGSIRQGLDADLVVFSTDPLDPGARPLAVWIDGALIAGSTLEGLLSHDKTDSADPDTVFIGGSAIEQHHHRTQQQSHQSQQGGRQ